MRAGRSNPRKLSRFHEDKLANLMGAHGLTAAQAVAVVKEECGVAIGARAGLKAVARLEAKTGMRVDRRRRSDYRSAGARAPDGASGAAEEPLGPAALAARVGALREALDAVLGAALEEDDAATLVALVGLAGDLRTALSAGEDGRLHPLIDHIAAVRGAALRRGDSVAELDVLERAVSREAVGTRLGPLDVEVLLEDVAAHLGWSDEQGEEQPAAGASTTPAPAGAPGAA